jgi:hypothetical protein
VAAPQEKKRLNAVNVFMKQQQKVDWFPTYKHTIMIQNLIVLCIVTKQLENRI